MYYESLYVGGELNSICVDREKLCPGVMFTMNYLCSKETAKEVCMGDGAIKHGDHARGYEPEQCRWGCGGCRTLYR